MTDRAAPPIAVDDAAPLAGPRAFLRALGPGLVTGAADEGRLVISRRQKMPQS